MIYIVIVPLGLVLFAAIAILSRAIELRKSVGWATISATIVSVRSTVICDVAIVFIDIIYEVGGRQCKGSNLNTYSCSQGAFRIGSEIDVLVDPENPEICRVERKAIWDGALHRMFRPARKVG